MRARIAIAAVAALAPSLLACGPASRLPEGAAYLPPDSRFVLSLDIPTLASTDLYRTLMESGGAVGVNRTNLLKFAQAAGLDWTRDVKWLTFVGRGERDDGISVDQLSAVASGTFDGRRVHQSLKDSGLPAERHVGVDIFPVVIVEGRCRFCISVLDDATAAFGDGETLRSLAEVRGSPQASLARDAGARRLLARIDRRAAAWGLVRGRDLSAALAAMLARLQQGSGGAPPPAPVTDLSFFVTPGEKITVAVDALTGSPEDALLVADVLEGAGALGRLALRQARPEASGLLSSFRVEVDGRLVRASASVPQARLVELARSAAAGFFGEGGAAFTGGAAAVAP